MKAFYFSDKKINKAKLGNSGRKPVGIEVYIGPIKNELFCAGNIMLVVLGSYQHVHAGLCEFYFNFFSFISASQKKHGNLI